MLAPLWLSAREGPARGNDPKDWHWIPFKVYLLLCPWVRSSKSRYVRIGRLRHPILFVMESLMVCRFVLDSDCGTPKCNSYCSITIGTALHPTPPYHKRTTQTVSWSRRGHLCSALFLLTVREHFHCQPWAKFIAQGLLPRNRLPFGFIDWRLQMVITLVPSVAWEAVSLSSTV